MKLLNPTQQKNFKEGTPIKVDSLEDLLELERQFVTYFPKHKWGGEIRPGEVKVDIPKEEFPIIVYVQPTILWDNLPEEESDYIEVEKD